MIRFPKASLISPFVFLLALLSLMPLQAQDQIAADSSLRTFDMKDEVELRTGDNLDSLLNLWYVGRSLENAVDDYSAEADTLIPDFSDSVYVARLAEIPSVVDLTYNRIVRNYINV